MENRAGRVEEAALRTHMRVEVPRDVVSVRGHVRDVPATLVYRLDPAEHERRVRARLDTVRRLQWLDVLLGLPIGLPVDRSSLTPTERRIIPQLPAGCVQDTPDGPIRTVAPPLSVELAVVSHRDWERGLVRAGHFGGCCTRVVAVPGVPDDLAFAQTQTGYYGVGLVVNAATIPVLVVEPEAFNPDRFTPASWQFAEQVYAHHLTRRYPI